MSGLGSHRPLERPFSQALAGQRVLLSAFDGPDRALEVGALVVANLDRLGFMPWVAAEPSSDAARRELLSGWAASRKRGGSASYGIEIEGDLIGLCGLERRLPSPGAVEIGYWLDGDAEGQGFVSEAVELLRTEAFAHPEIDEVWIIADEANVRSQAVPRRCGFELVERRPARPGLAGPRSSGTEACWRSTKGR